MSDQNHPSQAPKWQPSSRRQPPERVSHDITHDRLADLHEQQRQEQLRQFATASPEEQRRKSEERTEWLIREYGANAIERITSSKGKMKERIDALDEQFRALEFTRNVEKKIEDILRALQADAPDVEIDEATGAIIKVIKKDPDARYITSIWENGTYNILNPGMEGFTVNVIVLHKDITYIGTLIDGATPEQKSFLEQLQQTLELYGQEIDSTGNAEFGIPPRPNVNRHKAVLKRRESPAEKGFMRAGRLIVVIGAAAMAIVNGIISFVSGEPPTAAAIYAGLAALAIKPDILTSSADQKDANQLAKIAKNKTLVEYAKKYGMEEGSAWAGIAEKVMDNIDEVKNVIAFRENDIRDIRKGKNANELREELILALMSAKPKDRIAGQPLQREHMTNPTDQRLFDMICGSDPENPSSERFREWAKALQQLGQTPDARDRIRIFIGRGYYLNHP